MSHMVIFRTPEGKPGYQPAETVQEAVSVVERLRNDDGVENVRIFRLEEVQFELRPYFKVELAEPTTDSSGEDAASGPAIFGGSEPATAETDDELRGEFTDTTASEFPAVEGEGVDEAGAEHEAEVPPPPSAAHPPWAAPPPPPAPVDPPAVGANAEDESDEFSGAGQRRGLFGR